MSGKNHMATISDPDLVTLYRAEAARVTAIFAPKLTGSHPPISHVAAKAANQLCRQLGTDPAGMRQILVLPETTDFRIKPLAAAFKEQPEALFRLGLIMDAANAIAAKCGDVPEGRIWWHSRNADAPFYGETPMGFVSQKRPEALLQANYAIMTMR